MMTSNVAGYAAFAAWAATWAFCFAGEPGWGLLISFFPAIIVFLLCDEI
jgi:hypothetical protein